MSALAYEHMRVELAAQENLHVGNKREPSTAPSSLQSSLCW